MHILSYIKRALHFSCWSATLKWPHSLTIANILQGVGKYMRQLNKMQIIHLTSLSNVTCLVWRSSFFQIIRINLSQMLLLCLVWAAEHLGVSLLSLWEIHTFCNNVLSTKCLVQFIMLSIVYLKWVTGHVGEEKWPGIHRSRMREVPCLYSCKLWQRHNSALHVHSVWWTRIWMHKCLFELWFHSCSVLFRFVSFHRFHSGFYNLPRSL